MAEGLARAGARIVLSSRDKTKAESALASLRANGTDAHFIEVDVTDETACRAPVTAAVEKFDRLDILVNKPASTSASGRKVSLRANGTRSSTPTSPPHSFAPRRPTRRCSGRATAKSSISAR
jgi:NAD(P)-dependent dehydrogenase (short-subunit alcohol dehydrogenase family)